jgi:Transposase IS4
MLIFAFRRIKFKVCIITKSACYGIKLYVVTDAETALILKTIIYTGAYRYNEQDNENMKKKVAVVKQLCLPFECSHRATFVKLFYTLIDLLKELDTMDLYVTSTVMRNRLPKETTIAKASREFKNMERGDHFMHKFSYELEDGTVKSYGLVCWKDRDIVYCMTNSFNTTETETYFRQSNHGRVEIHRPTVIDKYNYSMGGVDLADLKRLHSNCTIMGQHCWWLKLFF